MANPMDLASLALNLDERNRNVRVQQAALDESATNQAIKLSELVSNQGAAAQEQEAERIAVQNQAIGRLLSGASLIPDPSRRRELAGQAFGTLAEMGVLGEDSIEQQNSILDLLSGDRGQEWAGLAAQTLGVDVAQPEGFSNVREIELEDGSFARAGIRNGVEELVPGSEGRQTVRSPGVTVNMGGTDDIYSKEVAKGLAGLDVARITKRSEQANEAVMQNVQLQQISEAIMAGGDTGPGEETLFNMRALANTLTGVPLPDNASQQEMIRAVGNSLALRFRNPESGLGLPGATSNRDLEFLKSLVPGLGRTEEGNFAIIDAMLRLNDFKVDLAAFQDDLIAENDDVPPRDLEKRIRAFVNDYEIFDTGDRMRMYEAAGRRIEYDDDGRPWVLKVGADPSKQSSWESVK